MPVRIHGGGRFNDLDVQTTGEGLDVAQYELAVFLDGVGGEVFSELSETKGDQDADDVCIVAEVEVQILIYREGGGVVV